MPSELESKPFSTTTASSSCNTSSSGEASIDNTSEHESPCVCVSTRALPTSLGLINDSPLFHSEVLRQRIEWSFCFTKLWLLMFCLAFLTYCHYSWHFLLTRARSLTYADEECYIPSSPTTPSLISKIITMLVLTDHSNAECNSRENILSKLIAT